MILGTVRPWGLQPSVHFSRGPGRTRAACFADLGGHKGPTVWAPCLGRYQAEISQRNRRAMAEWTRPPKPSRAPGVRGPGGGRGLGMGCEGVDTSSATLPGPVSDPLGVTATRICPLLQALTLAVHTWPGLSPSPAFVESVVQGR